MRHIWTIAAVIASLIVLSAPTEAEACRKRRESPLQLFDQAATVALVTVRSVPSAYRSPAIFDVERVLKGPAASELRTKRVAACDRWIPFEVGTSAIVFLSKNGQMVGSFNGYVRDTARWEAPLAAWAKASSPEARVAVLIDAVTGTDSTVGGLAASLLVGAPKLLKKVDSAQRSGLEDFVKANPTASGPAEAVLARLKRK